MNNQHGKKKQGPYSPIFFFKDLGLVLQIFLYQKTFGDKTIADWPNYIDR